MFLFRRTAGNSVLWANFAFYNFKLFKNIKAQNKKIIFFSLPKTYVVCNVSKGGHTKLTIARNVACIVARCGRALIKYIFWHYLCDVRIDDVIILTKGNIDCCQTFWFLI